MRIQSIQLQNFRNHQDTTVSWAPHLNLITGPNGAGKTNLIDAIHYLCMARSFAGSSNRYMVHYDAPYFMVSGEFHGSARSHFRVTCSYAKGNGKRIFVNDSPLSRLAELIGMIPVVVLSPQDRTLTSGGPKRRRSFLDSLISQTSASYLQDLIDFNNVRKQRNALLKDFRGPKEDLLTVLEPWDAQLVESGSRIVAQRANVLSRFQDYLTKQYKMISGMQLQPGLQYQTFCEIPADEQTIKNRFHQALDDARETELKREFTTVGPHRDEIVFYLDDFELRKFGSQGQHRLFALSLKLAQLTYFSDKLDELPIFLLDDVFGDLDERRTDVLLKALAEQAGQTFITSANPVHFSDVISFDDEKNAAFTVNDAVVTAQNVRRQT
jgi:DNA replication and repair protein RecF